MFPAVNDCVYCKEQESSPYGCGLPGVSGQKKCSVSAQVRLLILLIVYTLRW